MGRVLEESNTTGLVSAWLKESHTPVSLGVCVWSVSHWFRRTRAVRLPSTQCGVVSLPPYRRQAAGTPRGCCHAAVTGTRLDAVGEEAIGGAVETQQPRAKQQEKQLEEGTDDNRSRRGEATPCRGSKWESHCSFFPSKKDDLEAPTISRP